MPLMVLDWMDMQKFIKTKETKKWNAMKTIPGVAAYSKMKIMC